MHEHSGRKSAGLGNWKPVAFVAGCALIVVFYLVGGESEKSATPTEVAPSDEVVNSAATEPENSPDSLVSRVQGSVRLLASDGSAESPSGQSSTDDGALYGQHDLPGFSEEEVRLLHARQQREMEHMLSDLDAIVIESDNGDRTGITVRELRSLHEQQERELDSAYDEELVIPAGDDGSPALTVADLRTLQENQVQAIGAKDSTDEIILTDNANGAQDRTQAEVAALHEREPFALENDAGSKNDYPAPVPEGGNSYMTVDELRKLHKSQSQN